MSDQIISLNQTTMHAWASGQYQTAVEHYFKLNNFTSEKMADGSRFHDEWNKEVLATKCLPKIFGGAPLTNPLPEKTLRVKIHPWLELYGTPDLIDSPAIHEYKTGKRSSESYASSWQTRIYAVLATYSDIYIDRAYIHTYDQYVKKTGFSVIWITDRTLQDTVNYIETIASEMMHYFSENDLWAKFGHNLKP